MFRGNLVNVLNQGASQQQIQQNLRLQQMQSMNMQLLALQSDALLPTPGQKAPAPTSPIILDSSTAIKLSMGTVMYHERALMARNDIWHRVLILRGGSYDKEVVLKSILKAIHPADLIPVKYQIIGEDACFIARNCDRALDQLCKTSLIVQCEDGIPLILSITLAYASIHDLKINIQPLLLTVLKKRYDAAKKSLNLENFHRDPEIYDIVYCPLSQSRTMAHVLKLSKTALGPYEHLNLRNNELTVLGILESSNLKMLKSLDLSFNDMIQAENLMPIKSLGITELWLDGNPLCENYSSATQYVESIRHFCPRLAKLDGIQVSSPGLPLVFKTYVKNWKRRKLVEQFVEHFFTAYDHIDRTVMRGLYHDKAWYSTTVGTPTSPTSKKFLEPFGQENRNLLIFGKNSQQLLHYGQEEILKVLRKLPPTQHILKSLCCDLIYDNEVLVTIVVEGLFKLLNAMTQTFSFNRTFVLTTCDENEFKIINDQYHVYLPVHGIDNVTYALDNHIPATKFYPTCFSFREKEEIICSFQAKTTMDREHCERYLEEAEWNLKKALQTFVAHCKNGTVGREVF